MPKTIAIQRNTRPQIGRRKHPKTRGITTNSKRRSKTNSKISKMPLAKQKVLFWRSLSQHSPSIDKAYQSPQKSQKQILLDKLKDQDYFRLLNSVGTEQAKQAQNRILRWLDSLIKEETNLNQQVVLDSRHREEELTISPFEWFNLVIQDSLTATPDKNLVRGLRARDENNKTSYSKGKFYQTRFEIALEVLKGLGVARKSSKVFEEGTWQDQIGIDALIDFDHLGSKYGLPIQIKSSAKAVETFFSKSLPERLRKDFPSLAELFDVAKSKLRRKDRPNRKQVYFQRKNILAFNLSQFSISQLIQNLTRILSIEDSELQTRRGLKMIVPSEELGHKVNQKTLLIKSKDFNSMTESQQKNLIAGKYLSAGFA